MVRRRGGNANKSTGASCPSGCQPVERRRSSIAHAVPACEGLCLLVYGQSRLCNWQENRLISPLPSCGKENKRVQPAGAVQGDLGRKSNNPSPRYCSGVLYSTATTACPCASARSWSNGDSCSRRPAMQWDSVGPVKDALLPLYCRLQPKDRCDGHIPPLPPDECHHQQLIGEAGGYYGDFIAASTVQP